MVVVRANGRSMEPEIHDGDFLVFRTNPQGWRHGLVVLAQYHGTADPETGGAFTVKGKAKRPLIKLQLRSKDHETREFADEADVLILAHLVPSAAFLRPTA